MTIPPVAAEVLTTIGPFPVTNTFVNSTIVMLVFVVSAFVIKMNVKKIPGTFQSFCESIIEFFLKNFDQVTGSPEKSKKFLPIVGTMFLFILCSNWFGLLPGTGTIGVWQMIHGEHELVPILRSAGSDLNLTLSMALISVIGSHLIGMMSVGFFVHWNKFIQLGSLWHAIKTLNPTKILVGVIEFLVGFIELFSEAAKVVSLSLRLFGNVFAGEVLLTVISSLVAVAVPLPFLFLELIVGLIQATVFSMLTLVYLSMMTTKPAHAETHTAEAHA